MSERGRRILALCAGIAGIAAVGAFDYASGTELRVYPLYYGPIGLLAWRFGRRGAVGAAALSAGAWVFSNFEAGMQFSRGALWIANATVHGISFLIVGLLIATLGQALETARTLSRTDALTRLRNSRAFFDDTTPLLALCRRNRRPITLAYVDLDNFKAVNDRHGHQAGDELLRMVAEAMLGAVRPSDVCARLGGDEFAILLPELGAEEAAAALERVRAAVIGRVSSQEVPVTVTIGAATFHTAPADLEALVRRADELMYTAKAAGRDRLRHEIADAPPGASGG